ncbi:MAG: ABC transporter ATP-binding protein/permease [Defluviitaleaceae bacterium]|nr:ABC transporter ATP-binding protein/permease [Defluviitaleaceae bacterium]
MKKIFNSNLRYSIPFIIYRVCMGYIKTSKWLAVLEHFVTILGALSITMGIISTRYLFDSIVSASIGYLGFWQVSIALGIMVSIIILQQILNTTQNYLLGYNSYKNVGIFMSELMLKLSRISAKNFEDVKFLDNIDKTKICIEYESLGYFSSNSLRIFTYYLVFFISISIYLFTLSPSLIFIILISFIPAILGQLLQVKIFSNLHNELAPLRRKFDYYSKTIVSRQFFKETRMLGAYSFFHSLFIDTLMLLTKKTWKVEVKAIKFKLLLNISSFIGFGVSIFILFNATITGDISVGAFAAILAALSQIFSLMNEVINEHISNGSEILGQIINYYRIMDMEEVDGENEVPDFTKGIVAKNISFTYPNSENKSISNVSLKINNGETIAIVGENGAGKSTLVKLLIGLYIPDSGTVEIGGLDTKKIHPNSIFKNTSAVFQNYQRYKMTLSENVMISDTSEKLNENKINSVLQESGFNDNITLNTMLSTEFGGIDLSGGQWQRVAIARGLYRINEFIVLDEPTSAIDPIEEERIYNQFKAITTNKCAIIVTHRLGSVKLADRIIVVDSGKIVDIGTHNELLSHSNKYSDMWNAQSKWI